MVANGYGGMHYGLFSITVFFRIDQQPDKRRQICCNGITENKFPECCGNFFKHEMDIVEAAREALLHIMLFVIIVPLLTDPQAR